MAEVDPGQARDQAREVLEGDRYQPRDVPRPLRGVLRWIGDRLGDVFGPLADAVATPAGLIVALVVIGGGTALVVTTLVRRRTRVAAHDEAVRRRARAADPTALEEQADRAEAAGDMAAAVRLRFRAGVARLEQAGVVPARSDATTGRLLRRVPVPSFAPLARTFDEVAYGGRPATRDDVEAARRRWPEVVAAARDATSRAPS